MLCTINDYEFLEWHELFSKKVRAIRVIRSALLAVYE